MYWCVYTVLRGHWHDERAATVRRNSQHVYSQRERRMQLLCLIHGRHRSTATRKAAAEVQEYPIVEPRTSNARTRRRATSKWTRLRGVEQRRLSIIAMMRSAQSRRNSPRKSPNRQWSQCRNWGARNTVDTIDSTSYGNESWLPTARLIAIDCLLNSSLLWFYVYYHVSRSVIGQSISREHHVIPKPTQFEGRDSEDKNGSLVICIYMD